MELVLVSLQDDVAEVQEEYVTRIVRALALLYGYGVPWSLDRRSAALVTGMGTVEARCYCATCHWHFRARAGLDGLDASLLTGGDGVSDSGLNVCMGHVMRRCGVGVLRRHGMHSTASGVLGAELHGRALLTTCGAGTERVMWALRDRGGEEGEPASVAEQ